LPEFAVTSRLLTAAVVMLALAPLAPLGRLHGQPPAATRNQLGVTTAPAAGLVRGPREPVEVEAFMDGLMAAYMRDKHIAGITVSVVRNGALLFAKGYGYADVARRAPVDPDKTLFRIGSVAKLFTWTAVMQLHEQGKLDLAADVNEYLDFAIPSTYPQPITLRDILTHTPGLEEDSRDLFTEDSTHITPMSTWLPAHMPRRVRPPATFSSYSNWATAVAGYIVERVGGEPTWDDYMDRHLFGPLGMTQSTGRQPLPARLVQDASVGYAWKDGEFVPKKFEIVTGAPPAGSISASATDMAKFMIAHLNGGALGDARILGEREAALMHTRIQGHDPRIPGFAHGFYEQSSHGLRIIGHGGDTQYFHTSLSLIPSEGVGVFMSSNTDQGGTISFQPFLTAFLDHYYPVAVPVITPSEASKQGAKRYAGEYMFNRRNESSFQKAAGLVGSIPIVAMPDGSLLAQTPFGALRLVAVDSLLWRDVNSDALVAFRADADGRITHGFLAATPMMAMDKVTGLAAPGLHRAILIGGLLMFLALVVTAVVRFFLRKTPGRLPVPAAVTSGRRAMAWAGVLLLAFVGVVAALASNPVALLSDSPTGLKLALALPVLSAVLALWALWSGVSQWRAGDGTIWMRLRHSGALLVALAFFWSLYSWNLLGWHF